MLSARRRQRGFTLTEMMVTITLMAILMMLAVPSMREWIRNSKIRAVSDSLQNGLRLAQAEALRRNRQVVFTLTNGAPTSTTHTAVANGKNWSINTVKAYDADTVAFIESGILSDVGADVQITGPVAVCFNSVGRLVANTAPGITGASCALPTTTPPVSTYNITFASAVTGSDRPLRVTVALGGQVRMCDPARSLSSSNPDGCP